MFHARAVSSAVEHCSHTAGATGSIPVRPTIHPTCKSYKPLEAVGEPPVVSRSTTQKVTSRNGRPSSSKLRWASHRDVVGVVVLTNPTVGVGADTGAEARGSTLTAVSLSIPGPTERWRCAGCGNLTRFDVSRVRRTTEFWHFDLAGEHEVEDTEVHDETVESVTCRWCGRSDAVEVVARAES